MKRKSAADKAEGERWLMDWSVISSCMQCDGEADKAEGEGWLIDGGVDWLITLHAGRG